MAFSRFKHFTGVKVMQWGRGANETRLKRADVPFCIIRTDAGWEINLPISNTTTDEIEYQHLANFSDNSYSWSQYEVGGMFQIAGKYPYPTFREAFMAAKELREFYAQLPIKVVAESGEEGVIIGSSTAEEVAAVLTYS